MEEDGVFVMLDYYALKDVNGFFDEDLVGEGEGGGKA